MKKGSIVAIIRGVHEEHVTDVAKALIQGGITAMEVSLSDEERGLACIRTLRENFGDSINLGVGTVIKPEQVDRAVSAGAQYIITPGWDRELSRYVLDKNITLYPGVFTPGEVMQAKALGVDVVKLFPAGELGASYVKSLAGPFPNLGVMAVGGVNLNNIAEYYKAGCSSFGIGSDLVPRGASSKDAQRILKTATQYVQTIAELEAE